MITPKNIYSEALKLATDHERRIRRDNHIHTSQAAKCLRYLYYRTNNHPPSDTPPRDELRKPHKGIAWDEYISPYLAQAWEQEDDTVERADDHPTLTYTSPDGYTITGTPDLILHRTDGTLDIIDLKQTSSPRAYAMETGNIPAYYRAQLTANGWLAEHHYNKPVFELIFTIDIRDTEGDTYTAIPYDPTEAQHLINTYLTAARSTPDTVNTNAPTTLKHPLTKQLPQLPCPSCEYVTACRGPKGQPTQETKEDIIVAYYTAADREKKATKELETWCELHAEKTLAKKEKKKFSAACKALNIPPGDHEIGDTVYPIKYIPPTEITDTTTLKQQAIEAGMDIPTKIKSGYYTTGTPRRKDTTHEPTTD